MEQATAQRDRPGYVAELSGDAGMHRWVIEDGAVRLGQLPVDPGISRGRGGGLDAENRRQSLFFKELAVKIERSEHDAFSTREVASRSFDTLPYGGQIAQAESSVSCLAILCNGRK